MDPAPRGAAALVTRTWLLLVLLGAASATIAGAAVGADGAISATVGVGLVAILFGVSVVLLRWTAARPQAALGVLLAGLGARVVAYLVVLDAAASAAWLHGASLALATVAAFAITLIAELVWLARTPQLFALDVAPRARGDVEAAPRTRGDDAAPRTRGDLDPAPSAQDELATDVRRDAMGIDRTPELTP